MKFTNVFLAASLAVNAALVGAFVMGVSGDPAASPGPSAAASAAPVRARAAVPAGVDPELWNKLPAGDWPALMASLHAKGFPPSVIRAIVAAQVSESFRDRRKALGSAIDNIPFWKNPIPDPQTLAAQRALSREEQKILKNLFGPDLNADDPISAIDDERRLGGVPPEKRDQVRQILQEFNDQRNDIYDRARGGGTTISLLPDDQARLRQLDNLQHAELAKVLTPQELEDYDIRSSNTANSLRNQLTAFNATEGEFRALFRLQSAFDAQWGQMYATPSQDEMRARSAAQGELNKQIEAALGPQRYADYQRSTDYSYRQATTLVARLELPHETADQLYAVRKDIEDRMRTAPMPPAQRAALAEEATAKVSALLGPRGFEAYKQNGGQWLQNLVPRPSQPRPAITSPGGG
jgi:hypothetical protein